MSDPDDPADEPTGETRREGRVLRKDAPPDRLARGTAVGRYLILDVLGSGGMGVVYAAFDPELDRKVAIKLMQAKPNAGTQGDQAWLLREAQALARLSHPNVISVHDVGTLPGDRVFIAMEYVDGATLRHWLKGARWPWREVLTIMRPAGAGLAAAHAAGLVHRDFKPDNVLVGTDGRVRVLDFGLARLHTDVDGEPAAARTSDLHIALRSPLSETLTTAGTVLGTPEYMAPELYDGKPADARSDQFSFGVVLYEALFWKRPFGKQTPRAAPTPPESDVPAHLQRIALRAIALDRDARFPSMDSLLTELSIDVGTRRKRAAIVVGAVAGLGLAVGAAVMVTRTNAAAPSQLCTGADRRLVGVWDDATRAAVEAAFTATDKPFAAPAYAGLARALDRYAGTWTEAATDTCAATRLRGEQTEEVMSLRQGCLDQRLSELRALTQLLAKADDDLVARGEQVALGLEPVDRCADVAALRAPGRPPEQPAEQVAQVSAALADSKAAILTGHYPASVTAAKQAAALADQVKYPPWRAEARLVEGAALAGLGQSDDAAAAFADATFTGLASNRVDVTAGAAQAAASLALGTDLGEARLWTGLARAAATRMPPDDRVHLRQLEVEGLVAGASGDLTAAIAALEQARAAAEQRFGVDDPRLWAQEELIAVTYAKSGAYDRALPHYERALRLHQQSVGPDHPEIALLLTNLGPCYQHAGEPARARAAYGRALAIRERAEGPKNPMLILTLNNMADGLIKSGDAGGAVAYAGRARDLAAELVGRTNPLYHVAATTHAEALIAAGRVTDARAAYDEVLAIETDAKALLLGATLASRATAEAGQGRWADAVFFAQRAITAIEATNGKDASDLLAPLTTLGRAELALGHGARARPALERALVIGERARLSAADLEPTRALLRQLRP